MLSTIWGTVQGSETGLRQGNGMYQYLLCTTILLAGFPVSRITMSHILATVLVSNSCLSTVTLTLLSVINTNEGGKFLDLTVAEAAERCSFSPSRFGVLYKAFFNVSFNQDLQEARIFHAKYLLKSTNEPISAIAFACGYQNEYHFIRQFKKHTLTTPNKWRNIEQSMLR